MLILKPILLEKIWGGTNLKKLGFDLPSDKTGEVWLISGHKSNSNQISNKNNITLRDYYHNNPEEFNNFPSDEFPLLLKIIDANDDLSIQVHPNDYQAQKLENYAFGKSEAWYILNAKPDQLLNLGLNVSTFLEAKKLIEEKNWKELLRFVRIEKNQVFSIPSGTVHALQKGTLAYEIQQSSDITYRLYDYDRIDKDGKARELHLQKALEVINFQSKPKAYGSTILEHNSSFKREVLLQCDFFELEKWTVDGNQKVMLDFNSKNFLLVTQIEGDLRINHFQLRNNSIILTSENIQEGIRLEGKGVLLISNPIS